MVSAAKQSQAGRAKPNNFYSRRKPKFAPNGRTKVTSSDPKRSRLWPKYD